MRTLARALAALLLMSAPAAAQSTAAQVLPGSLTSSGCPSGYTYCYIPYSATNPLPVTPSSTPAPLAITVTDKGGTISVGGTAQTAIASNMSRKAWCIQNSYLETEALYVRVGGTASATTGTQLAPGQQVCNPVSMIDTSAISVFAATGGHRYFGYEGQ